MNIITTHVDAVEKALGIKRQVTAEGIQLKSHDGSSVYSPVLSIKELEEFCGLNFHYYNSASILFQSQIENSNDFEIVPFWGESQASIWIQHKFIKDIPFQSKQAIFDIKQTTESLELSCNVTKVRNAPNLRISIFQKTVFSGSLYVPFKFAPLDLHIDCQNSIYKVEAIYKDTKDDSIRSIIPENNILFSATNPNLLRSELLKILEDIKMVGIHNDE